MNKILGFITLFLLSLFSYAETTYLYVTSYTSNQISVYKILENGDLVDMKKPYKLPGRPEDLGFYNNPTNPNKFLFIVHSERNTFTVLRALPNGDLTLVDEYPTVNFPDPISAVFNDKYVYLNSSTQDRVDGFSFDNQTGRMTRINGAPFNISGSTYGYMFSANNKYMYEQYIYSNQFASIPIGLDGKFINSSKEYIDSGVKMVATGASPMHYAVFESYLYLVSSANNGLSRYHIINDGEILMPANYYSGDNLDYKFDFQPLRMTGYNGRIYVTDSGNNINVFSIGKDYRLTQIQKINCGGVVGRTPVFTYPGYAYQPIFQSNQLAVYSVDSSTGKLTQLKRYDTATNPFHIKTITFPN